MPTELTSPCLIDNPSIVARTRSEYPPDFQEWISTDRNPNIIPITRRSISDIRKAVLLCPIHHCPAARTHSHTRNDIHSCASNISGQDRYQINVLLALALRYSVILMVFCVELCFSMTRGGDVDRLPGSRLCVDLP